MVQRNKSLLVILRYLLGFFNIKEEFKGTIYY